MNTIQTLALKILPKKIQNRYFLAYQIFFNLSLVLILFLFSNHLEKLSSNEVSHLKNKIDFFLEETKTRHKEKLPTYSCWEEIWNLKLKKQDEKVYFQLQQDKSILDNYDYFYLYFDKSKPFIVKKNSRTKTDIELDRIQIESLFQEYSKSEKVFQKIISIGNEYYLISLAGLKDDSGNTFPLDGILFFLEKLEFIKNDIEKIFSIETEISKQNEIDNYKIFLEEEIALKIKKESTLNKKIKPNFYLLTIALVFIHFLCSIILFKKLNLE